MTLTFRPPRDNLPVQPAQAGPKNSYYLESEKVHERLQILAMSQIMTWTDFCQNFSEGRFNNIELQLNNNQILNKFDLIIMGGLIHTVANNKHRYRKSENAFSDIMADIFSAQMRNLVKVRLMSQNTR